MICWSVFIVFFEGTISSVLAVEEVVVVHAPESVKFVTSEPIRSSYLADIFSAMLAQTIKSVRCFLFSMLNMLLYL